MVQRGRRLRFTLKPRQRLRVLCDIFRKEFQRYKAKQAGVLCFIDNAHSTTPESFEDAVVGDGLADEGVGVRHSGDILGRSPCKSTNRSNPEPSPPCSLITVRASLSSRSPANFECSYF